MATVYTNPADTLAVPSLASIQQARPFSLPRIGAQAILIVALLLLNKAGIPGNAAFFAILLAMIAISPQLAFKALTIGFLGLVANQEIVPKTPVWTFARLLLPIVCWVRFCFDLQALHTRLTRHAYYIALLMFVAVAALLSIPTQYFVAVALLKAFNFAIAATAMFAGAEVLRVRKIDFAEWYVTLFLVTVMLGFGSIATGIGYNMRGTGLISSTFNGPFYHSNCLGPMAAMMVVYLACAVMFGRYRNRWLCLVLAACLLYFMALTQSRTSFASMLVGLITTIGTSFFLVRRKLIRIHMNISRPSLVAGVLAAVSLVILADAMTGNRFAKAAVSFANKGGKAETLDLNQVVASRAGVVEASWRNFLESPLIGIGFEVAKTEYFQKNASLFSAPIEKGFLPVAVLEESGIIGTLFFLVFLLAYLWGLARQLNIPGIALFVTFLAVNCGESMFFSMGGHGGLGWLLFVGGAMLGSFCIEPIRPSAHSGIRLRHHQQAYS